MKMADLIKHLIKQGCVFVREGSRHSVFYNSLTKRSSTVPRHNEINDFLSKKICRDLGTELPRKFKK